jgi:hypothetical protein
MSIAQILKIIRDHTGTHASDKAVDEEIGAGIDAADHEFVAVAFALMDGNPGNVTGDVIDDGSDRVDGALFLAILDFSGSKLPDEQLAQPPWRDPTSAMAHQSVPSGASYPHRLLPGRKKLPPIVIDSNCSHYTS